MLKQEITTRSNRKDLFTLTIVAANQNGEPANERQFLIDVAFKPNEPGFGLRPAETQLLLAYIGETLKEIET